MILTLISILGILYIAQRLDEHVKIPATISLITLGMVSHYYIPGALTLVGGTEEFAAVVVLLLPVLLLTDALDIDIRDLKDNAGSLLYLAGVSVVLSILSGILVANTVFQEYNLNLAALILLFAMVLPTDPVSVMSVFSKFELPKKLKILVEGESLFNDASAVISYVFIGLPMLAGTIITGEYITQTSLIVISGTIGLGAIFGVAGVALIKNTNDQIAEMTAIIITVYGAFYTAEHFYKISGVLGAAPDFKLSGILALLVAALIINFSFAVEEEKENSAKEKDIESKIRYAKSPFVVKGLLSRFTQSQEKKERHDKTRSSIKVMSLIANTALFIALGELVEWESLLAFWKEILVMFVITTGIRGMMMAKFAMLAKWTHEQNINIRWWSVLTFSGMKGGLSIVMLTMLPGDFMYYEMFKAIVIGTILLSTFVYSAVLIGVISYYKSSFKLEKLREEHGMETGGEKIEKENEDNT